MYWARDRLNMRFYDRTKKFRIWRPFRRATRQARGAREEAYREREIAHTKSDIFRSPCSTTPHDFPDLRTPFLPLSSMNG